MKIFSKLKKVNLTTQIAVAFILAIIVGCLLQGVPDVANAIIKPFGNVFLNLLKFIVAPLVLLSITSGILSTNNLSTLGKIGLHAVCYFMFTTVLAVLTGLVTSTIAVQFIPLSNITIETATPIGAVTKMSLIEEIVNFFPSNMIAPFYSGIMIQIIVIAVVFGIAIVHVGAKGDPVKNLVLSLNEVVQRVLNYIMMLAPIGIFCMLTPVIANNGPSILGSLAALVGLAHFCFLFHAMAVYVPCLHFLGGYSPLKFLKHMQPALLFAYSSDSSVATLPYTMKSTERMHVRKDIRDFVLPLGATINMDGVAIYLSVATVFVAACCGIHLTMGMYMGIAFSATIASIGTPSVPGASLTFMSVIFALVGIPIEYVAVIAGVDRIVDMARTVMSIVGDASCAVIMQRHFGDKSPNPEKESA
jgi:Na+/H+-dicarboxylate symporter